MSAVSISVLLTTVGATFTEAPEASSTSSPLAAFTQPSKIVTKPIPPASTTPACLRTGSISGVLSSTFLACCATSVINSSISGVLDAILTAYSAVSLETVRIVPSVGFITAL